MIRILKISEEPITELGRYSGICYNSTNPKWFEKIGKQIMIENHGRCMEFVDVIFEFDGYSAKMVRELFRKKMASELQASTRYISYEGNYSYETPPSIEKNEEAKKVFDEVNCMIGGAIDKLKELGVPVEDYSNLLPLAYTTKGVYKINLRSLIDMFGTRSCTLAYHEYRKFMKDIKDEVYRLENAQWNFIADNFFVPKCIQSGYCVEYKRHCGIRPLKPKDVK